MSLLGIIHHILLLAYEIGLVKLPYYSMERCLPIKSKVN